MQAEKPAGLGTLLPFAGEEQRAEEAGVGRWTGGLGERVRLALPKALSTQNSTVSLYPLQLQRATENQPQAGYGKIAHQAYRWSRNSKGLAFIWPLTLAVSVALVGSP